jgi:PAS domain S-box-containing protein
MRNEEKSKAENDRLLRIRAEIRQQAIKPEALKTMTPQDVSQLVQELQVYQIELEMQNEQLRETTEQLELTSNKYQDLYEFAPVGYLTLDQNGIILEANLTSAKFLNVDRSRIIGRRFAFFMVPDQLPSFYSFHKKVLDSDAKQTCELAFTRPDGSVVIARLEAIAIKSRNLQIAQVRIALIDITVQVEAQKKFAESQQFIKHIADASSDILTVYDLETKKNIYVNREMTALLGYSPEQIRGLSLQAKQDLIYPEDLPAFLAYMASMQELQDNELKELEYRVRSAQGKWCWLRIRTLPFQRNPATGKVSQIISIQQDISFRKKAEEELNYKNQIIEGMLTNLPVIVSRIAADGTVLAIFGSGLKAMEAQGIPDLQDQNLYNFYPQVREEIQNAFSGKIVNFISNVGKTAPLYFQNYLFYYQNKNEVICFSIDITEQQLIEQRAQAEREFSQNLLDNSVDGILAFDTELRFTAWNKVMEENAKLPKDFILGKKIFELFSPFADSEGGLALAKVLQGERIILHNMSFGIRGKVYEVYLNPLFHEDGTIAGGLTILHDVSLRKRMEDEALRLKLEQQKEVLNAVLDTQEEERKRIAEALHNGVGQLLYAAKLNLERQQKSERSEAFFLLIELLDEAIRETRTISFELMPRILEDFGLETALEELIKRICMGAIHFNLQTNGLQRFSETIEIAVYRIIQELINNILKHSQATQAKVEVSCKRNIISITVQDNGIGFDLKSKATKTKGIGLTGIRNRVKLLDGVMNVETAPNAGTSIKIQLKAD